MFCGRVFFFLFQSFPLGDKSSVNLRGEYHTENVTTFEERPKESEEKEATTETADTTTNDTVMTDVNEKTDEKQQEAAAAAAAGGGQQQADNQQESKEAMDLDTLYPMFWGLQGYFAAPTKMFDQQSLATFKTCIEATLSTFTGINADVESRQPTSGKAAEDLRRATKRRRGAGGQESTISFNPKYLTSRDLFGLEVGAFFLFRSSTFGLSSCLRPQINDTAFRRHVLVQALILFDFLLSLTAEAKGRLGGLANRSVLYSFTLTGDDVSWRKSNRSPQKKKKILLTDSTTHKKQAKWVNSTRKRIEDYLQQGVGGKFYYRMVDTVLSRDKNWVRWKAEGCPPIERPSLSATEFVDDRERAATKIYANKRLRVAPAGALDLKFLSDGDLDVNLQGLREGGRYELPEAEALVKSMEGDELDLEMAATSEETENLNRAKTSKLWRALRLTMKDQLSAFEKLDGGKNVRVLCDSKSKDGDEGDGNA